MLYPLLFEHLLKTGFAPPGHKLTSIVAQDLFGSTPLPDGPLDHLQHCLGGLLTKQPMANDVAAVVIDHPHEIDRIQALELKGHDVDLPHGVGEAPLESAHLRRSALGGRGWLAKSRVVDHSPHRLSANLKPFLSLQVVTDPPYPMLRMLFTLSFYTLFNDLV